jgi:hypothetical protein
MPTLNDISREAIEYVADTGETVFSLIEINNKNIQINIDTTLITEEDLDDLLDAIRTAVILETT